MIFIYYRTHYFTDEDTGTKSGELANVTNTEEIEQDLIP